MESVKDRLNNMFRPEFEPEEFGNYYSYNKYNQGNRGRGRSQRGRGPERYQDYAPRGQYGGNFRGARSRRGGSNFYHNSGWEGY